MSDNPRQFRNFSEFYPYYLGEHVHPVCRRLHFIGTSLMIALMAYALTTQHWTVLWLLPVVGYGFAWVGHYFFEHNRPATFTYPFYSLLGDFVMFKDMLTRRIAW